jgi:hypothetical protein
MAIVSTHYKGVLTQISENAEAARYTRLRARSPKKYSHFIGEDYMGAPRAYLLRNPMPRGCSKGSNATLLYAHPTR